VTTIKSRNITQTTEDNSYLPSQLTKTDESGYIPTMITKRPRGGVNSQSIDVPISSIIADANATKEVKMSYDASAL